jgi:kynurenine 3-monooxygenase
MVTVRCRPWHVGSRVCLLGDAAHAVVPFYGQGMNAAFEDVLVLSECMDWWKGNLEAAFVEYEQKRKPNADALAELAVGNFIEMRDKTGSRLFRWKKKYEKTLAKLLPGWFIPLYVMVTFTRIPYSEAVARSRHQNKIVSIGAIVLMVALVIAAWRLLAA